MGTELTEKVLQETGLPDHMIRGEFEDMLKKHGLTPETLTLDTLRDVLADYLQDVFADPRNRRG